MENDRLYYVLPKNAFEQWMHVIINTHEKVFGPMKNGNVHKFDRLKKPSQLDMYYPFVQNNPMQVLFGGSQEDAPMHVVRINKQNGSTTFDPSFRAYDDVPAPQSQIALGLRPHMIHDVERLVAARNQPGKRDKVFNAWLEATTLIGIDYPDPQPNSFCNLQGTHTVGSDNEYDGMATDLKDGRYLFEIVTERGWDLFTLAQGYTDATQEDLVLRNDVRNEVASRYPYQTSPVPYEKQPEFIRLNADHEFFKITGEACTECGGCVVHTCGSCAKCFAYVPKHPLADEQGHIDRVPVSCQNGKFWQTADKSIIKKTPAELRHWWFTDQIGSWMTLYDQHGNEVKRFQKCTGCGQCQNACPPYTADRPMTLPIAAILKIIEMGNYKEVA